MKIEMEFYKSHPNTQHADGPVLTHVFANDVDELARKLIAAYGEFGLSHVMLHMSDSDDEGITVGPAAIRQCESRLMLPTDPPQYERCTLHYGHGEPHSFWKEKQ